MVDIYKVIYYSIVAKDWKLPASFSNILVKYQKLPLAVSYWLNKL